MATVFILLFAFFLFKTKAAQITNSTGQNISIYCDGYYNCSDTYLFQNAENVNIYCYGAFSCVGSFYCPSHSENVCNVVCDGDDSCYYLDLMVSNNFNLNWLTLTFVNNAYGGYNKATVTCLDDSVSATILQYNGEIVCRYYSSCCPYSKDENKYCDDSYNKECIIDCTSQYKTTKIRYPCGYGIIDASYSNSLSVLCHEPYSCLYLNITCPKNGDDCNITSSSDYAAQHMNIIGNINNNININCYGKLSCIYMNFEEIIESASNNIYVVCNGPGSCHYAHFELQNNSNFNILCDGRGGDACYGVQFNAQNANNIYIECRFDGNCDSINVYAERSNELNIICDNGGSCSHVVIFPPTNIQNIFSLKCYDGLFDYSCDYIHIYIWNDFMSVDLLCDTAASCNYIIFYCMYGQYVQSTLNIDENNEITCSDDECCPLQGTKAPTTPIPTEYSTNPTKQPTEYPTQSHDVYSSTSSYVPSSNNQITTNNNNSNMIRTTNKTDSKSSDDSGLGTAWIILIVVCVLVVLIFAIYISFKIGERSALKKHVKSFELISESQPNDNQVNQQNTSTD